MAESVTPSEKMTTYKPVGEWGLDFGWVTELDYFDDDDDPTELIEEKWERVSVRTFWQLPSGLSACGVNIDCDEDATCWVLVMGKTPAESVPEQACEKHSQKYEVLRDG